VEKARPNLIIKSAAVLLRRIISQQFLRALKTHVLLFPSHANDLIDRSPFPESPSPRSDSTWFLYHEEQRESAYAA